MPSTTPHRRSHPRPATARAARKTSRESIKTARALAEDLRESQLQLERRPRPINLTDFGAADLSPVPLALLTRGGTILVASSSLYTLFDAAPQQVRYRPLAELLHLGDEHLLLKFLAGCASSWRPRQAQFAMSVPGKPPKDILLVVTPAQLPNHPQTAFRAAFIDLTDSDPLSVGPRAATQNTRLMQAIDGIVWEADYPARFTFVSPQVERILGFTPGQWLRDPAFWEKHIHRDDRERVLQSRAEAARKAAPHVLEYRMITASRGTVWVKDSAMVLDATPSRARICGIITDVSDLQEAREELARANRNLESSVAERTAKMEQSLEAMETLCYGIAHDLKAPLRGLQGFIGILTNDYAELFDKDASLYAERCQVAVRRMGDLIEAVLTYGRLNHTIPELVPVHLGKFFNRILQNMEAEITARDADIQVQMTMPHAIANPFLLEQVFTNLIANALKFARPNTRPEISISATQVESANPSVHESTEPPIRSDRVVRVTVTDNGIGIPPEFVERMFGMFQKAHRGDEYPGTGIGLAIVKRAVELMNGRVGVFSEPNHGSSFWIELPAASEASSASMR